MTGIQQKQTKITKDDRAPAPSLPSLPSVKYCCFMSEKLPFPPMKTALAFFLLLFALNIGCKNPETTAYKTSKTAHVTAVAALRAWNDYVTARHPSVETEKKVQTAFDTYKTAQLILLDATKAYMEAGSPPPATVQEKFELALQSAGNSLANLIGLIQSFGVKL